MFYWHLGVFNFSWNNTTSDSSKKLISFSLLPIYFVQCCIALLVVYFLLSSDWDPWREWQELWELQTCSDSQQVFSRPFSSCMGFVSAAQFQPVSAPRLSFPVGDIYTYSYTIMIVVLASWCMHPSVCIKLYNLSMCSSPNAHYTLLKLLKKLHTWSPPSVGHYYFSKPSVSRNRLDFALLICPSKVPCWPMSPSLTSPLPLFLSPASIILHSCQSHSLWKRKILRL